MSKPPFRITPAQATSPVWHALRTHYEERLTSLRAQNDNASLDAEATAALRGRIAEVKLLISLADDLPDIHFGVAPV